MASGALRGELDEEDVRQVRRCGTAALAREMLRWSGRISTYKVELSLRIGQ
jgi:hypothetical protein